MHFEALMRELPGREKSMKFLVKNLMTTFAYYFLVDHYLGDEMTEFQIGVEPPSNSLLGEDDYDQTMRISLIQDMDKIFVQNNFLDMFLEKILPHISCRFVLITGQWNLPALTWDHRMELLLNDKRVYRWFSQNPVDTMDKEIIKNKKYIPIAYGLNVGYDKKNRELKRYADALVQQHRQQSIKSIDIFLTPMLKTHPSRKVFPDLPKMPSDKFYENMSKAQYVVSPIGDRNDTYRHMESIGLGAFPISNVGPLYRQIYGENMVYLSDTLDILTMYDQQTVPFHPRVDKGPCRDLICVSYWRDYLEKHIHSWDIQLGRLGPIEKKIHLSWKNKNVLEDAAHYSLIRNGVYNMKHMNLDYVLEISDDQDVDKYIQTHISEEDYERIRDRHIVEKTDLWRLLKVYHEGGIYMDLDRFCNTPLSEVLGTKPELKFLLPTYRNFDLSQDILLSSSKNFILEKVIQLNLERRRHGVGNIVQLGPETYTNAVTEVFLGYQVPRGDNLPLFESLRELLRQSPYLDTWMEEPPYSTVLYRNGPAVEFDKDALYAHQGVGFHP